MTSLHTDILAATTDHLLQDMHREVIGALVHLEVNRETYIIPNNSEILPIACSYNYFKCWYSKG
jgi:hypothetical protein